MDLLERGEKARSRKNSTGAGIEKSTFLSSSDEEAAVTESEEDSTNGSTAQTKSNATDDEEEASELAKLMPSISREDSSPHEETKEDWQGMNDELAEFLGSDADDDSSSEAESARSDDSEASLTTSSSRKKRKRAGSRGAEATDREGDSDASASGSRLQKRKRKALARTSSLNNAAGLKAEVLKVSAGKEGDSGGGEAVLTQDADAEDTDGDLEAELEAEMLRQALEDGDEE